MGRVIKGACLRLVQRGFVCTFLFIAATYPALAAQNLNYSGRLTNANGSPMTGPVEIVINFFRAATDGEPIGPTLQLGSVELVQGLFTVDLKLAPSDIDTVFSNGVEPAYIQVTANGKAYPRQRLLPVPLALRVPVDNSTVEFNGSGLLAVKSIPIAKVEGLSGILGTSAALKGAAGSTTDGYLTKDDWQRFDAKQDKITSQSTLAIAGLNTSVQKAIAIEPYGVNPGSTGELRFSELGANGGNFVGLKAPDALTANLVWTLPTSLGTNGQVLSTNGSGNLNWITPRSGTVTQISTGPGLVGGPITMSGQISLADTTVVPGYYPRANISVDAQGRITAASQGSDVDLTAEVFGTLPINRGGTATATTPTNGQILIGNGTGYNLATLTAGTGMIVTNSAGGIKIDATEDPAIKVSKAGDTMTGGLMVAGNIGIGTTSANSALDIQGGQPQLRLGMTNSAGKISFARASDGLYQAALGYLSSEESNNFNFASTGGGSYFSWSVGTTANEVMRLDRYGNVGIGTTNPTQKLEVNGTVKATALVGDGNQITNLNSSAVNWGLPGAIGSVTRNSGSFTTIASNAAGSASSPAASITGNWFSGGTTTTTKPQLLIEPSGATSNAWSTGGTGVGVNAVSGFTGQLIDLQVNGSSKFVVTGSGNVGIGTTMPVAPLELHRIASFHGDTNELRIAAQDGPSMVNSPTLTLRRSNSSDAQYDKWGIFLDGLDSDKFKIQWGGSGAYTNQYMTITTAGNVGIGTASPTNKLQVYDNANGGVGQVIKNANNGTSAYSYLLVGNDTADNKLVMFTNSSTRTTDGGAGNTTIRTDSGDLNLSAGGGQKMTIQASSGNVGIGTTIPTSKLQLQSGEIGIGQQNDSTPYMRLGMDSGYYQYLANNAYWTGSAYNYVNSGGYGGTASMIQQISGQVSVLTASGGTNPISWNNRLTILNNGNVGIGTTAPSAPMHITATSNTAPNNNGLYVYNPTNAAGNNAILSARVAGSAAGSPFVSFDVNGVNGWSIGLDNADAQKFKIGNSWASPATNTYFTMLTNGNVGIGTVSPTARLAVAGGQAVSAYYATTSGTIDWNNGNIQNSSVAAGTMTLNSMIDGGVYTLILSNATGGSYTFTAPGLTFRCKPACPVLVTAGSWTVVTVLKAGSTALLSWGGGYQ